MALSVYLICIALCVTFILGDNTVKIKYHATSCGNYSNIFEIDTTSNGFCLTGTVYSFGNGDNPVFRNYSCINGSLYYYNCSFDETYQSLCAPINCSGPILIPSGYDCQPWVTNDYTEYVTCPSNYPALSNWKNVYMTIDSNQNTTFGPAYCGNFGSYDAYYTCNATAQTFSEIHCMDGSGYCSINCTVNLTRALLSTEACVNMASATTSSGASSTSGSGSTNSSSGSTTSSGASSSSGSGSTNSSVSSSSGSGSTNSSVSSSSGSGSTNSSVSSSSGSGSTNSSSSSSSSRSSSVASSTSTGTVVVVSLPLVVMISAFTYFM